MSPWRRAWMALRWLIIAVLFWCISKVAPKGSIGFIVAMNCAARAAKEEMDVV